MDEHLLKCPIKRISGLNSSRWVRSILGPPHRQYSQQLAQFRIEVTEGTETIQLYPDLSIAVDAPAELHVGHSEISAFDGAEVPFVIALGPASASMQGRDILDGDVLRDAAPVFLSRFVYPKDVDTARFSEVEFHAVVEGEWKLIARERGEQQLFDVELYHLGDDPGEQSDRKELDPERARRAHDRLKRFLERQASRRVTYRSTSGGASAGSGDSAVSEGVLEQLRVLGYVE